MFSEEDMHSWFQFMTNYEQFNVASSITFCLQSPVHWGECPDMTLDATLIAMFDLGYNLLWWFNVR